MLVNSPLEVYVSKRKKFILNLNNYRNAHFHVLNAAKIEYKRLVACDISKLKQVSTARVEYVLFPKTKRLTDLGNVISIHKKFFEDALVELGKIEDDNYTKIVSNSEFFGCVDKKNPRVEIKIIEL